MQILTEGAMDRRRDKDSVSNSRRILCKVLDANDGTGKPEWAASVALVAAILVNRYDNVQRLLECGVSPNVQLPMFAGEDVFITPLAQAIRLRNISIIKILLEHGADPFLHPSDDNSCPFCYNW